MQLGVNSIGSEVPGQRHFSRFASIAVFQTPKWFMIGGWWRALSNGAGSNFGILEPKAKRNPMPW